MIHYLKNAPWIPLIVSVVAVGLYCIPGEPSHPGRWESLHITIRLFIFERDLPAFPSS